LKKDKHKRKEEINLEGQSLNFFLSKIPLKKRCAIERIFRGPWFVSCQEQFTYSICGKYLIQMFDSTSLSKLNILFRK
jgi:hypothetical protein